MPLLFAPVCLQAETLTYIDFMGGTILIIAMLAVVVVLVIGIFLMATGGEKNRKYGNKLMGLRVTLQAIALAILALLFFLKE